MRLAPPDHQEAISLARRLEHSDEASAGDDRRALLLFWYGFGAGRLRADEDVLLSAWERHGGADHPLHSVIRADHERLERDIAAVAAQPQPSAVRLRHLGAALMAHLHLQDTALCAVVSRVVPSDELVDLRRALHVRDRPVDPS
jgi:hypothetical protein